MKRKHKTKKIIRFFLIALAVISVLVLVAVLGMKWYINTHKEEILAKIEHLANDSLEGELTFDSIQLSPIKSFPDLSISIYNVRLRDSLYTTYKKDGVFMEEIHASASVIDLWNEELKINEVELKNGQVNLFVDSTHYTNTYIFKTQKKQSKNNKKSDLNIVDDYTDVSIENVGFWFRERVKNKRITAHINKVNFEINPQNKKEIIPEIEVDILMKELGLNLANGSFFNNERVTCSIVPNISPDGKTMDSDWIKMKIGEQNFLNKIWINFPEGRFLFNITIEEADFKKTVHLLSQNIQRKLNVFEIAQPLKAEATIAGKFEYKNNPVVNVHYFTEGNSISIPQEKIELDNVNLKGRFINRISDDKEKQKSESVKNFRLGLETFEAQLEGIPYSINDSEIYGTDQIPLGLNAHIKAKGKNKNLSKLINSENFQLTSGTFSLDSRLKGNVNQLTDIFSISDSEIEISNCRINYKPENTSFEVPHLKLRLNKEATFIEDIVVQLKGGHPLKMHGELSSFASYFNPNLNTNPRTTLYLNAEYLNAADLVKTFAFNTNTTPSTVEETNLKLVKKTLSGIMKNFNPHIDVSFKKFKLLGQTFSNVKGILDYTPNKLLIKDLQGDYKKGSSKLDLFIDLEPLENQTQEETLLFGYDLEMDGKIEYLVEILQSDNFFFSGSPYQLHSNFEGKANSFQEVIKKANIDLGIGEGSMYYKNVGLTFNYDTIQVSMHQNDLQLKDFIIKLPKKEKLSLQGYVKNFSHVFDVNPEGNVSSNITITSDQLNLNNFISVFNGNANKNSNEEVNLKKVFKDVYLRYNPSLNLKVGSLQYLDGKLDNLSSSIEYKDIDHLNFEFLTFDFAKSTIKSSLKLDLSQTTKTPFYADLYANKSDIESILEAFNNFNFTKLDHPTELKGNVSINLKMKATIDDHEGVDTQSILAGLKLNLDNLRIKNFEPIINIGNILFKKARFEDIQVLPFEIEAVLKDKKLYLAQTSIQSTAFDAFIEGVVDTGTGTEMWIAIPWENLKKRDYKELPEYRNAQQMGKKIYMQVISDHTGKLKYHLRLSDKKYKEAQKKFTLPQPFQN